MTVLEVLYAVAWWQWVLLVIFIVLAFGAYVMYRGYQKVKPNAIDGIPIPPLTHPVLGHPEKMLHPLKHEYRLEVCEAARASCHQLALMKHASIFVNDAEEAARILNECDPKGPIYNSFRFDPNTPDILASDDVFYAARSKAMGPALKCLVLKKDSKVYDNLVAVLTKAAASGATVDVKNLYVLFSFDCVCEAAFGYDLGATNGSLEGKMLHDSLQSLADAQAGQGVYPAPNARVVPAEEVAAAKANWKKVLNTLLKHVKDDAAAYKSKNQTLDVERNFGHSLVQMLEDDDNFTDANVLSEIHQVLRHGHECLAGTLSWLTYVLYKTKDVKENLEKAILEHKASAANPYPEYLECVLKETLRRYGVLLLFPPRSLVFFFFPLLFLLFL
jgi:cytochrome P450